jgi:hypothetical protein
MTFERAKDVGTLQPVGVGGPAFHSPWLQDLAGSWTGKLKMKLSGVGAMEVGTEDNCMLVCGGRWLHTTSKSGFVGTSTEMHQLLGVDETGKKVVSLWVDCFGANFDRADGKLAEGRTWTLEGKTRTPDGKTNRYTEESSWKDADHRVLRWVIDGGEGGEESTIEIAYTRKK